MTDPFTPRVGGVLNADIAVPEHAREMRFYARVLGTGDDPLWREELTNNLGLPVIGLGARAPEYADLPLQWMPHIQVADVATSAARAIELGGRELMHGRDDDGNSQWAVLLDPNGAAFGLVPLVPTEALPAIEAGTQRIGCIAWLDLTVSDAGATRAFYEQVVGWSAQDVEMEAAGERYADYEMLGEDGHAAAGICHARGANLGLPPVWMIYLPVGDLAASLECVEDEGGRIIGSTLDSNGRPATAVIQDPVGATLALAQG